MGTLDSLELRSPDSGHDVVFDRGPIALKSKRLHLALAERGEPFVHPLRNGDFVGGLIGALDRCPCLWRQ